MSPTGPATATAAADTPMPVMSLLLQHSRVVSGAREVAVCGLGRRAWSLGLKAWGLDLELGLEAWGLKLGLLSATLRPPPCLPII